jgi:putative endonuclease
MKHINLKNKEIGRIGEDVSVEFLMKRGFSLVIRNYLKKWGEIDIIVEKEGIIHFVEVKTVTRESLPISVIHETSSYEPEDNLHPRKLKRISKVIRSYIAEQGIADSKWQFDVLTVFLNMETRRAKVKFMEDVII